MNNPQDHYLVIIPHYWGRSTDINEAFATATKFASKDRPLPMQVSTCCGDSYVDDFGRVSFPKSSGPPKLLFAGEVEPDFTYCHYCAGVEDKLAEVETRYEGTIKICLECYKHETRLADKKPKMVVTFCEACGTTTNNRIKDGDRAICPSCFLVERGKI